MSLKPNPLQTIYIRDDIGISKKYQRNPETNELEDITTRSRQYDNQLSPISILVCEHHCKPIALCFNTVEKRQMQYEYNYDNDRLEEIRCDKCIDKGKQLKPGDLMFMVSPPRTDVVKFFVGEDGRVEKRKGSEETQKFEVLPATEIKNADKKVIYNYVFKPFFDQAIRPFYSESSPILNNMRVIVGENVKNQQLGKFVFDPYSHLIFQIEVEDVEYDLEICQKELREDGGKKKVLALAMSAMTQKAVAILKDETKFLEKRHLNPDGTSERIETEFVVGSEEKVRQMKAEWMAKTWHDSKVIEFYKLIADYMVINLEGNFRGEIVTMKDVYHFDKSQPSLKDAPKAPEAPEAPEDPEDPKDSESVASEDFEQIDRDSQASDRSEDDDSYDILDMDEIDE